MKSRFTYRLACSVLAGLISACAAIIPQPHPGHSMWASQKNLDSSLAHLGNGRRLYILKCDGCHSLLSVNRVPTHRWPAWIDSMRVEIDKAKGELTSKEAGLIRNYLVVASGYLADSLETVEQNLEKEKNAHQQAP